MAKKRTYTIAEAAELVGLSRKALARRIERGSIRSVVRNGRRLIPRSELVRAGLLPEEGEERGNDVGVTELVHPPTSPGADADTALVSLVRELMDRVERQAHEIAQFRALTVQAESLRADRELVELRTRLAALEGRSAESAHTGPAPELARPAPSPTPPSPRVARSSPIWLPPSAAPATPTAAAPRRPLPDAPPARSAGRSPAQWVILALEVAFVVLAAVVAGLVGLRPIGIIGVTVLAWAVVATAEAVAWHRRGRGL